MCYQHKGIWNSWDMLLVFHMFLKNMCHLDIWFFHSYTKKIYRSQRFLCKYHHRILLAFKLGN